MKRKSGLYEVLPMYLPWTVAYWNSDEQLWELFGCDGRVDDGFFRVIDEEPVKLKNRS